MNVAVTRKAVLYVSALILVATYLSGQQEAAAKDTSAHTVKFVQVEPGVKLEVLDWGGKGRPMIFLAGMGFTAHEFDDFAPRFTNSYHVYGVTRRGFGHSSAPTPNRSNYTADRLGDDVLAVMHSLSLDRPVLVGHSLAGQELSSIGSRHPEKVSALVYLDAGYSYALYDPKLGDLLLDSIALRDSLNIFLGSNPPDMQKFLTQLQADVDRYSHDIKVRLRDMSLFPPQPPRTDPRSAIAVAIATGKEKYTHIPVPCLVLFAAPHAELADLYPNDPKARAALAENDRAVVSAQAEAFRAAVPTARVLVLPNASHFIFTSNEAEVEREMRTFLASLR